jgi:hypothetical protein
MGRAYGGASRCAGCAIIHAADIQDRDGGVLLMSTMFGLYPSLLKLYADSGYQGPKFRQGPQRVCRQINMEIVKRSDGGKFVVLPRRWASIRLMVRQLRQETKRSRMDSKRLPPHGVLHRFVGTANNEGHEFVLSAGRLTVCG